jgi:hypothetical protein
MSSFDPYPYSVSIRGTYEVTKQWFALQVPREVWNSRGLFVPPPEFPLLPTLAAIDSYEKRVKAAEQQTKMLRDNFLMDRINSDLTRALKLEWGIDTMWGSWSSTDGV